MRYPSRKTHIFILTGLILGVGVSIVQSLKPSSKGLFQEQGAQARAGGASSIGYDAWLREEEGRGKNLMRGSFAPGADDLEDDSEVKSKSRFKYTFMSKKERDAGAAQVIVPTLKAGNEQDSFLNTDDVLTSKESASSSDTSGHGQVFSGDDLALLKKSGAEVSVGSGSGSSLIGGVRSSKASSTTSDSSAASNSALATQTPTATPVAEEQYSGQARGYEIFYLMQPEARSTAEKQIQALIDSNLSEVYLGILTDGSFGKDYSYVRQVLDRLHAEKRSIVLAVYAVNGSSMRQHKTTKVASYYTKIEPARFRNLIKSDSATRDKFKSDIRELKPLLEYNLKLNSKNANLMIVMLEDNLDGESYLAMRELAKTELGALAEYMRNPCEGCYDGNDSLSFGDHLILHEPERISGLGPGDAFSLDGTGIKHSGSSGTTRELTLEQIKAYQKQAYERGLRFFAYWDGERQGLTPGSYPPPVSRNYATPSGDEYLLEQQAMQDGLSSLKN